ncbi:hypothetical protein CDS [Bradyrhizobium sp.]|nr:hypothetical protein CDS [Bradyrhizobium sp.]
MLFEYRDILEAYSTFDVGRRSCVARRRARRARCATTRPASEDMKRWGVLTIGTGLGNARVTNRGNGKN